MKTRCWVLGAGCWLALVCAALLHGQGACLLTNTSGCPCAAGESPCAQTFIADTAQSLSAIWASLAGMAQPSVPFGAQIIPANGTYAALDFPNPYGSPTNCFTNNSCAFANAANINAWMDRQRAAGMLIQDVNIDVTPWCMAAEYAAYAGSPCAASGNIASYLTHMLAVYDAMFDHAKATGVTLHLSPAPNQQYNLIWGILCSLTASTMTVNQMAACIDPMYQALIKHELNREGVELITRFTGGHEPTGLWKTETGQTISAVNWNSFIGLYYAAIHAVDPNIQVDAGYLPSADASYWQSALTSLSPSQISIGFDVYPYDNVTPTSYSTMISNVMTDIQQAVAAGFKVYINESSAPRDVASGNSGESGTYYGCTYYLWTSSGLTAAWQRAFYAAMSAAGASGVSVFPAEELLWTTQDGNLSAGTNGAQGSNCQPGSWITAQMGTGVPAAGTSNLSFAAAMNAGSPAVANLRTLGTTAQQALIAYTAPDANACSIQVSPNASLSPLALDVDPGTFANANLDLGRAGTLASGLSRTVAIGQRTAQYATAGTYAGLRHYSRSLETNTGYFGQIFCYPTGAIGFNFTTKNIPLGQTYGDPWLSDAAHPGDQPWPEWLGGTTPESFIDPLTGALEYRVGMRGNVPEIFNLAFGTAYNQGQMPCDAAGPWVAPCNVAAGSGNTTVGNSAAPLVLRPPMSNNPPWDPNYGTGWSLDQLGLSLTGSVSSGTDVLDVCLSLNAGASCASAKRQMTMRTASGTQTVGVAPTAWYGPSQLGTTAWELDTNPRLNAQETSTHSGTATVSGNNVTWVSGDPFSLYWTTGGNGRIRLSANNDACTAPPAATTSSEYTITWFVNGNQLTVSGNPPGGSVYWCANNFALMVWRDSPNNRTVTLTAAVLNALGSYAPITPDNGTGTACFDTEVYGGWLCLYGGLYWINPLGPSVVYYGLPKAAGLDGGGNAIANSWMVVSPAQGNSASIDQTQTNLTFYMVGMDPAGNGPLVIQGVFAPGATPVQYTTPQSGVGIAQIGNATPSSTTAYSVTWNATTPSPWSMTWTNLTPQSTLAESIVEQMAAFDPTFNPSYFTHSDTGGWNCQLSGIMTTGVFFFPCYTLGGDSPAWIFAFQPGDANPAHAGQAGGPRIVGAINTFNTPNGPVSAGQGAVVGRTLHAITEAGETGWVGITANEYSIYTPITKSNAGGIPASGPAKCNTFLSTLSATADCIAIQMAANGGSYEPYLVGAPNPPFAGTPGELRTLQVGDTACVNSSASGCNYAGAGASELMTLVEKNLGGTSGLELLQRNTDGVEAAIASGPVYFWWQSYQSSMPSNAVAASNFLQLWWNPLAGCNGAPDPHGNCLMQDTNLGYGHGEWRDGGESLGVNVPSWKIPGAAMSEIAWPGDYQTMVGSVPGIFGLPAANMTPFAAAGVNYVSLSPPFAGAFGVPFQPDAGQHPNPAGARASAYEQLQAFDDLPLQGGSYDPAFAPVSGQLYVYQPGAVTDPDDFVTSGSVAYINRKSMATGAACGSHPLIDVSGPGASIGSGTGSSYTYCVARNSGECYAGSAVGNVYVNCPGVTYSYCNGVATHGGTPFGVGNDICVGNNAGIANNAITQYTLNHTDYPDAYTRVLATATARLRMVTGFENARLLPDNSWLLYPQEFLNYQRPSEMWMLQQPPYPAADSINRGTFVPVTVTLKPPAGLGANNAIVEFGYQEYGAPAVLNCTTRNDACVATAGTVVSGNQPYYFASENPAGAACAAGCTIAIPAISGRILYYQVSYRAGGNAVVEVGPVSAVVVP